MPEPQIDCVIPTHGRPHYLREALASVLAQTLVPVSVTVVSDDGDEESRRVVEAATPADRRTRVRFVHRESGAPGASASRNRGAEVGGASLLAFLDDDDVWEPSYLQCAHEVLVRDRVDVVVTGLRKFSAGGPGAAKVPVAGLDPRGAYRRHPGATGSNIVLTRAAFDAVGGFDPGLPVQNDRDLFLRLLLQGCSYAVQPEVLVGVRQHGEGRLTDGGTRRADGIMLLDAKHGPRFGWWDRRPVRYASHYTRMSAATSRTAFARSALAALANWSPTAGRDLPLDLFRRERVGKLVKELVSGAW